MAYTPQLSFKSSCTLRRISWALGLPMTKAIEKVFEFLPKVLDREKVCQACRDKSKCSDCQFQAKIWEENEEVMEQQSSFQIK